jgi:voltage-gated potassium channel
MTRFLRKPPSVRVAVSVTVTVTAIIVLASGILMRLLDHKEYPNLWLGIWWAIQTVTTVGYGDVTPKSVSGRIAAVAVMLEGIALLTIVTAAITSSFVQRAAQESKIADDKSDAEEQARMDARFDTIDARLERIEAALDKLSNT